MHGSAEKMFVGLGGAKRLTKKQILSMVHGAAVQGNTSIETMQKAIWDAFHQSW